MKPPQQINNHDCGVCLCLNLECLSRASHVSKLSSRSYKVDTASLEGERVKIKKEIESGTLRAIVPLDSLYQNDDDSSAPESSTKKPKTGKVEGNTKRGSKNTNKAAVKIEVLSESDDDDDKSILH